MYQNRRTTSRLVLADFGFDLVGTLFKRADTFPVRLRDLGPCGACFEFLPPQPPPALHKYDFLTCTLPLSTNTPLIFDAEVAWSSDTACGVRFVEDITRARLHDLIRLFILNASS